MTDDLTRYHAFWSAFFGVESERLQQPGVSVVRHAQLEGYPGVWFFVRGPSVIVSAPEAWVDRLSSQTDRIAAEPIPGRELLRDLFGSEPERTVGPAYQGCLLRGAFRPVLDQNVRILGPSDEAHVNDLRSSCESEEWEHSSLSSTGEPRFGYFDEGRLVAMAGLDHWSAGACGPGVLSHPGHRGRGYATAVVSAAVEHAVAAGRLLLYQTLLASAPSVGVARRLGFQEYARHLAVRGLPTP